MGRLIIKPNDIKAILGVSSGHARGLLRLLKRINNKEKHQKVTVKEFCRHQGLEVDEVLEILK